MKRSYAQRPRPLVGNVHYASNVRHQRVRNWNSKYHLGQRAIKGYEKLPVRRCVDFQNRFGAAPPTNSKCFRRVMTPVIGRWDVYSVGEAEVLVCRVDGCVAGLVGRCNPPTANILGLALGGNHFEATVAPKGRNQANEKS